MKRIIPGAIIFALVPCLGLAQSSDYSKGHGYGFGGAGGHIDGGADLHGGGGVEGFISRFVGIGVEAGYLASAGGYKKENSAIFSPNFVARFLAKDNKNKVEPFVTGGYTLFYQSANEWLPTGPTGSYSLVRTHRPSDGVNFGAGVNWWAREHFGLRFEFRDYVVITGGSSKHFAGAHIGLTFR